MRVIGIDLAAEDGERTVYTIDGVSYPVRPQYYLASCDKCGWIGSSEDCSSSIDDDVICPTCYSTGADCGKVATAAEYVERAAEIRRRQT